MRLELAESEQYKVTEGGEELLLINRVIGAKSIEVLIPEAPDGANRDSLPLPARGKKPHRNRKVLFVAS